MVKKSFQWILLVSSALLLTSCGRPLWYKADIQQGNIITPMQCRQIQHGMSKEKIKTVLGNSVLALQNNQNYWEYISYYESGTGKITKKKLTFTFENDKLIHFHCSSE